MATQHRGGHESGQQGNVKDPQNDGRLKENREEGRTKGTTPASEARSHELGGKSSSGSHSSGSHSSGSQGSSRESDSGHGSSHESGHSGSSASGRGGESKQGGSQSDSDDLKSREYRDEKGEVHHHTRTYMEQHGDEKGDKK